MPYLALYRKYRPRTFAEVAGQRHVTQTLANAVKSGRLAHAYLFCGPRGTGKTSTARALAVALNCEQGPTPEPCGECEACHRIAAGSALDVIEIDAASNRGIDEIRQLRERVAFAPADARYKVYIIDEVHMLTGEAFNAFLKTLEEPPPHVVFVLATTEPHRVLPTILSRCQRFDFHRVGRQDIEHTVRSIAEKEGIDIDERAVAMLVHAADGSVRDALTLFDQAIAYAEGPVSPEVVAEILGGIDFALVAEFSGHFVRHDLAAALALVDRVVAEGKELRQLVGDLISHYRNLLVLRVDRRGAEALALPEESLAVVKEQAQLLSTDQIVRTLDLLADTDRELRFTSQPRVRMELCAVRICRERPAAAAPAEAGVGQPPPARKTRAAAQETPASAAMPEDVSEKEPPVPDTGAVGPPDLAGIRRRWEEVITHLARGGPRLSSVSAFLRDAVPVALEDDQLTLSFHHGFHHDQIQRDEERREAVVRAISEVLGLKVKIRCKMAARAESGDSASGKGLTPQDVQTMFPGSRFED